MRPASSIINALLRLDPDFPVRLSEFEDRTVAIEIRGTGIRICLKIEAGAINVLKADECEAEATIAGSPAALFRMGLQEDVSDLVFSGDVEISGDTGLGRRFGKLLKAIEPDFEEPLSRVVGDVAAHQAMTALSALSKWGRRARDNFIADASEYLQEESRDVVSAAELDGFIEQVDELRDDTERLHARVQWLLTDTKPS